MAIDYLRLALTYLLAGLTWLQDNVIRQHSYSYKNLKQELKTVKVNSEKHTQVYGMYRAV